MGHGGSAVESPLIGHEFRFFGHRFHTLESSQDTGDGSLRFEYFAPPRANVSEHVHAFQEERFEPVSGRLGVRVGGRASILGRGQRAVGLPGVPHAWWNPSDNEEVCFRVEIRPGLEVETMLETVLGLMQDGKTIGPLPRNPLQLAVQAQEIRSWMVLAPMTKALFAPVALLAFVGRLLGYRTRYPAYSGPEAARTMRIEQSVEIERPLEEVFVFVADPRNDARWAPACEEVQKTSEGPPGVGTTFRQVGRLLGRRFEVPLEITAYEPNRKLGIKPGAGPVQLTHLRSVEGTTDGTRLTITLEGQTGGFFRVADPIFARLAKRLFKASLANLKSVLETRS
jgi:carbon monoxide dehydrogenase subunit G/quercetin dioxygenase-like cupin family protein